MIPQITDIDLDNILRFNNSKDKDDIKFKELLSKHRTKYVHNIFTTPKDTLNKMDNYEFRFYELNTIRDKPYCCKGKCFNNWVSKDDTLICGKCEKEKHIDYFIESSSGYLCGMCENSKSEFFNDFKKEKKKFIKGIDKLLGSYE